MAHRGTLRVMICVALGLEPALFRRFYLDQTSVTELRIYPYETILTGSTTLIICGGWTMPAKTLMIQGTSSSVGKSLLTAGLCRLFARRGLRVAPFKAQNMSNNAAVCPDGAEIGRAQAVQAAAARIEPTADMNPILLKPEGQCAFADRSCWAGPGKPCRRVDLQERKRELWPIVTAALDRLRQRFDLVIIEGAGSPVELNLAAGRHRQHGPGPPCPKPRCCWPATSTAAASSLSFSARFGC